VLCSVTILVSQFAILSLSATFEKRMYLLCCVFMVSRPEILLLQGNDDLFRSRIFVYELLKYVHFYAIEVGIIKTLKMIA
jgi:hypothetical protein